MSIITSTSVSSASAGTIPPRDYVVVVAGSGGDYTTLASAVADATLVSNGGTILIREGTYSITATVTLPNSHVTIKGSGIGNTVISVGANAIAAFSMANANWFTFEDFTISGTTGTAHIGFKVTADVAAQVRISRVKLTNIRTGITTTYTSNLPEVHMSNCQWDIDANAASVWVNGGIILVATDCNCIDSGSQYGGFVNSSASHIHLDKSVLAVSGTASSSTVDHGSFINCTVYGGSMIFGGQPISRVIGSFFGSTTHVNVTGPGSTVAGNMFTSGLITLTGIQCTCVGNSYVSGGFLGVKVVGQNCTITGNGFYNNGTAATGAYLIDCQAGAHATIICGNDINGHGSSNAMLSIASSVKCIVTGNRFNPDTAISTILESGTTNTCWYTGNYGTEAQSGVTLVGLASVYEGTANPGTTGTTTDAYATVFTHTNPRGLGQSQGTFKNTHASNGLTIEEQVIDLFGTTETQETAVVASKNVHLNPDRDRAWTSALAPWKSYRIRVKATSAGNQATFSYQNATRGAQS